jgi:PAS domain S-box-containing protein
MVAPPIPDNEIQRLAALRALDILDSDPEESFDRLARLTASAFCAPIAHVSLIDEHREWFKARWGLSVAHGDRQTAFCAHTIAGEGTLVVDDALQDPRFRDNPQVTANPAVRFYAGAALRIGSGLAVGTLCIKDHRPRQFSERERRLLTDLAAVVVSELEHRLAESRLRKWEHVFGHARWGIALSDVENPTLDTLNPAFAAMHGYGVEELQGRPMIDIVAPDARDEFAAHAAALRASGRHAYESRHVRKDGTVFPVLIDASAVRDRNGRLLYRAAHVQDITERRRFERALELNNATLTTQQETSLDGILVVDGDGRVVSHNQRFARMWAIPEEILSSRSDDRALEFAIDQLVDPQAFLSRVRYLYDHRTESSSDVLLFKDGRVFDRYSAPMWGPNQEYYGRVWYFRDVTDRARAERTVRESEERLTRILESAMDAIVTIDDRRRIRLFNAAAEDVFRCPAAQAIGQSFDVFGSESFRELLTRCEKAFGRKGARKRYMWAPEGLTAVRRDGREFPVEATISRVDLEGQKLFTIILRDVNDRLEAERELQQLQLQNVFLQEEYKNALGFEEIVGRSGPMQAVLEAVQQVASTETTVLLTGETGTGKELIARAIHTHSRRRDRMLVKVNCAALPAGLIESELFGHEKGAFTGALARKIGRFELADGGTIFLDEVGDLPLELQAKLLRVLQEGEFERVGATAVLRADVRVIAATNRDLQQEVEQGRFRADLFYRLNVFPIRLPPLRERPDDVPLLVQHFVVVHSAKMGKRIDSIPKEALRELCEYDWPGNVRELQNIVERGVILTRGAALELGGALPRPAPTAAPGRPSRLAEVERAHILAVLERVNWRVSGEGGAAEALGLKRTTLESRMKKLGIKRRQ